MKAKFLKPNNLILTKVAKEIPQSLINSPQIKKTAEDMLKIIQGEQKGQKRGVGLAAPQIGISKRIILVDVAANKKGVGGDLRIYINPKITWKSKIKEDWYEGCYSTGRICGIVSRSTSIKIQTFTLTPERWEAKLVEEKHFGYVARIFQHEIDHLDGKVFIHHIKDPAKLHSVNRKEFPLYRKGAWRHWPKKAKNPLVQLVKA